MIQVATWRPFGLNKASALKQTDTSFQSKVVPQFSGHIAVPFHPERLSLWQKAQLFPLLLLTGAYLAHKSHALGDFARAVATAPTHRSLMARIENMLLYLPTKASLSTADATPYLQSKGVRDVYFYTPDSKHVRLHAWYVPAQKGLPTAVIAHGQSENIATASQPIMTGFVEKGFGALSFDYRGFGASQVLPPSAAALIEDFLAASLYLSEHEGIPRSQQIAAGHSLGGAIALQGSRQAELNHNPFHANFFCSTFTSLLEEAQFLKSHGKIPRYIPINSTVMTGITQRFDSIHHIQHIHTPTFIMHGTSDTQIPFQMGQALYEHISPGVIKELLLLPDCDHLFRNQQASINLAAAHFLDFLAQVKNTPDTVK